MNPLKPVTATRATLGEGALWHKDRLYWVDIEEKRIYIYNPKTREERYLQLDAMVGTVVVRARGGLVAALENGFAFVDEETGKVEPIADPEADKPENRFNDGKCDPAGRLWAGTMARSGQGKNGALYTLETDGRTVVRKLDGVGISNGICWSLDHKTMYYVDSPTRQVVAFDYDKQTGAIANRRVVVEISPEEGVPDGMTIDERGYLWIALWDGWAVVCHDPATGTRHAKVELPAARITSCAFGGDDLGDLYITSARSGLSAEALARQPDAGGLFCTRVGVRGVPSFAYQG
mgnify:CR=1 FL=1